MRSVSDWGRGPRSVYQVHYIPLPRGEDGSFHFLYASNKNPCASDFKKIDIKLSDVLNTASTRTSILDVLRYRLEAEIPNFDRKKYAICPVRFKVEGEDLI